VKLQISSDPHCDVGTVKPIAIGEDVHAVSGMGDTGRCIRHAFNPQFFVEVES
jgi:hypothetical protein